MGIEALTYTESGNIRNPESEHGWGRWVSATATRNFVLNDPILDWLSLYGTTLGFSKDFELPGYDHRTDFVQFIMKKGREFEKAIIGHLKTKIPIIEISSSPSQARSLLAAEQTFQAMHKGEPAISQGVLWDAEHETYGLPDLLIRSDIFQKLFPNYLEPSEAAIGAPDLGGGPWHYRVVDIKFSTLRFSSSGALRDIEGSLLAYKVQVFIYNQALGRLQGYLPEAAYLLGRGWDQTIRKKTIRGTNAMERLGIVNHGHVIPSRGSLESLAEKSLSWIRKVRSQGATWQVFPEPSTVELWPNMTVSSDHPWHHAKQEIATQLEELTLVWHVGVAARTKAHQSNVFRWSDPACDSAVLGVTGPKTAPILDAILQINRKLDGPVLLPEQLANVESEWVHGTPVEFYVDFETVSDLQDDFQGIPKKGGQPLIFMIGCGHLENGNWKWKSFTVNSLCEESEKEIINLWFGHMDEVKAKNDPAGQSPLVFHWSNAEQSTFESAFNSAKNRHSEENWPNICWFDFYSRVVCDEPIIVQGSFGFGLKGIAHAMHRHGLIETVWETESMDGLGAMAGVWWSAAEAERLGSTLKEIKLMEDILRYNEIDCKAMMEIVLYLRKLVVDPSLNSPRKINPY